MHTLPALLSPAGETLAIIDDFTKLVWKRALAEASTFSMELPSTSEVAQRIGSGYLILAPDDPPIAYMAEKIDVKVEGRAGTIQIDGRAIDGVFGSPGRLVIPPVGDAHDVYEGVAAETVIKTLVRKNAGDLAVDSGRTLDGFVVMTDQARGGLVTVYGRYQPLLKLIGEVATATGLGWETYYDVATRNHVFEVIVGDDLSATVIFDTKLDAVDVIEWLRSLNDYASYAFVAGAGELEARVVVERYTGGVAPVGLERRELFVDAKDIADTDALDALGDSTLSAKSISESFEIAINPSGPFQYRTEWDLGDVVRVRNSQWGIDASARIVGVTSTINDASLIPSRSVEIGKPVPSLQRRISEEITRINTRE